ncbi:MAG: pantetheine-phosphate adenylyltransferase [Candidatus Coproplasma sp.]
MDKKICVFAGSFDPPTVGHLAVVEKSLKIFDGVTVALMINTAKKCLFTVEERLQMLKELFADNPAVKVIKFEGAAVDLLEKEGTPFYVRGIRDGIDFEYENRDAFASKKLKEDLITIYLPAEQDELHISSSLVRNSVKFNKDYENYIPEKILKTLKKFLEKKNV